jgi:hypothetical protein
MDTSENSHFRPNLSEDLQQCSVKASGLIGHESLYVLLNISFSVDDSRKMFANTRGQ